MHGPRPCRKVFIIGPGHARKASMAAEHILTLTPGVQEDIACHDVLWRIWNTGPLPTYKYRPCWFCEKCPWQLRDYMTFADARYWWYNKCAKMTTTTCVMYVREIVQVQIAKISRSQFSWFRWMLSLRKSHLESPHSTKTWFWKHIWNVIKDRPNSEMTWDMNDYGREVLLVLASKVLAPLACINCECSSRSLLLFCVFVEVITTSRGGLNKLELELGPNSRQSSPWRVSKIARRTSRQILVDLPGRVINLCPVRPTQPCVVNKSSPVG